MKENYIYYTLYRLFDYKIPLHEIHSFMYFLKACGAYYKYANNLDIDHLKYKINENSNMQNAYFQIIAISFSWEDTEEGRYYWGVINDLHNIIIFHKMIEKKLNFKELTIDITRFYHPQLFYNNMFAEISFFIKSRTIKDKTIKIFANELESYIRKIYYALT